jgi:hypothetical protein
MPTVLPPARVLLPFAAPLQFAGLQTSPVQMWICGPRILKVNMAQPNLGEKMYLLAGALSGVGTSHSLRRNFGSFCKKHFHVLATYHNVLITR